jgi:hypothetical protein
MAWEFHVLVVANLTATSEELLRALRERSEAGACRFTLVTPRSGPESDQLLADALKAMTDAGLEKVEGHVGNSDPVVAVMDVWDPMKFDEIVVSTLPTGSSRWLGIDLPRRLERLTSVSVRHVESKPPAEVQWERLPEREELGVLSPLAAALGGRGAPKRR